MKTTTIQLNENRLTIGDIPKLLATKVDKGYKPQPITPYLYDNGIIVKGDRNGFRFEVGIMPDQPKGLDLLLLNDGSYITIDNTSQLYRLMNPQGNIIASRVNNDYKPFNSFDKLFRLNDLTNPIKDNLSLAYKGYKFNVNKLKDWATVYNTLNQSIDRNQKQLLNKLNKKIKEGIKSENIKLMENTQLNKVVNTGQLNGESYKLERDYTSPITVADCTATIKSTIFKSNKSDNRIGVYALSWSDSLVIGYSAYFGIILNNSKIN